MNHQLLTIEQVNEKIRANKNLVLAGDEKVLGKLEKGNWIAGTTPYFMAQNGGEVNHDKVFVTELPEYVTGVEIKVYDESSISSIYSDAPENGFVIVIIPSLCKTHFEFSLKAPEFPDFATRPVIGWISGVVMKDYLTISPKVINGQDGRMLENAAVAMGVNLPKNKTANIDIVNIFNQTEDEILIFPEDGFSFTDILIDGKQANFADYLKEKYSSIPSWPIIMWPLTANYFGTNINVTIYRVFEDKRMVVLAAPVFKGVKYRMVKPIADYAGAFKKQIPEGLGDKVVFSCNCLYNFLFGSLVGKKTGDLLGPITFGEIAYQMLNQTLVYLTVTDSDQS